MNNTILITCAKGMSAYLQEELRVLGFPVDKAFETALEIRGTYADTLKLNLWLRTAHRVMYLIHECVARDADALHAKLFSYAWEELLHADGYICVTSTVENESIRDPRFANLRVKDAIVDRLLQKSGRRPNSGPERSDAVIHLHWVNEKARIFVDTSGESLNRRGYRLISLRAPMMETLAAGCVLAGPWRGQGNFISPMCGSGTLAIEAALIGLNRAPGSLRKNFGFMHIKGYREDEWKKMKADAKAAEHPLVGKIIATDISPKAIEAARENAKNAGVEQSIEFSVCDFRETPVPAGGGVIIFNPEYGERLGDVAKLEPTYKAIGDFLKQKCSGYNGYVFTGNLSLAKRIGLRSSRRLVMYNSQIECRLLEFELYEGTRNP